MSYQVFISFKNLDTDGQPTRDSRIAEQLYHGLKERGVNVFFSNEEVQRKCRPDYGDLIDEALESSRVLLLVGTSVDYIESKWVKYEWNSFKNEINSGRKDGYIIPVIEGFSVGDLPFALRHGQVYTADELDRAVDMVAGVLGISPASSAPGVNVGDCVRFGSYPQSGDTPELIEWRVLDIIDGKALMISESLLDCRKYNNEKQAVTWENCTLREWLNTEFVNNAFAAEEREKMSSMKNQNPDNHGSGTNDDNATEDYVFCLSIEEAEKYFGNNEARSAKPTAYAKKNGSYVNSSRGTGWWWLRSPGRNSSNAANVDPVGSIDRLGDYVFLDAYCVRPVILARI